MSIKVYTEDHSWTLAPGENVPDLGSEVEGLGKIVRIEITGRNTSQLQENWRDLEV